MFGWHGFGFGFSPYPSWISRVQIHGSEIPSQTQEFRNPLPLCSRSLLNSSSAPEICHTLSSSPKLFFFLSFSQQGLSLSTLFFLFILSISLFLLNLNHKGSRVFCGFHFFFCEFIWVSFDLCVDASMNCRYI